jgi:hypothetical protein
MDLPRFRCTITEAFVVNGINQDVESGSNRQFWDVQRFD